MKTDFVMNHVMLRVRDPRVSLEFYCDVLGMRLLRRFEFPAGQFSIYFVGFIDAEQLPAEGEASAELLMGIPGLVELTHNWGTETACDFAGYHNGNSEPRGFGHIGISVPSVSEACRRFEELNIEFVKRPDAGMMKGIAFIKDPDGYWIEILSAESIRALASVVQ
jgi:lactoylglutathione lyase